MTTDMIGDSVPTKYWHRLDDGRVQCDLCPRACKLREGQRGLCFVRANQGGQVVLTTYGRSSGYCVDPIEKKPLNHFLPGTPVLSFGTAGCNLACRFCQNWDISKSRDIARKNGVRYAYTGNAHDKAGQSTYCHACGTILIGRDWYVLSDWNLTADGRCKRCHTPCAGAFEPRPGRWGSRRQLVRLRNFASA